MTYIVLTATLNPIHSFTPRNATFDHSVQSHGCHGRPYSDIMRADLLTGLVFWRQGIHNRRSVQAYTGIGIGIGIQLY